METIIVPRIILNAFVKARPDLNFVYGYDVQGKGCFGQASIHGNPNCYPVPTMYKFCASGARYFEDSDSACPSYLQVALERIPRDKPVVVLRKLGQGCSRMHELAPRLFAGLQFSLLHIKENNELLGYEVKWDYAS